MYTRISRSGGRSYLQIVEGYRTDAGAVRQRVVANLGRLDRLEPANLDALINGLSRALGRAAPVATTIEYDSARAFGDVYALHALWGELGFGDVIRRALRSSRRAFDAEALVRAMVFNRLCAADSKLGCLEWLQTVAIPGMPEAVTHDQLLRTMDALMDHAEVIQDKVAEQLRPMLDQQLSVVFYDLTTIRAAGLSEQQGDVRQYGMAKEGVIARQFMLGVVQTAEGLPIYHEVFDGNQAEGPTLLPTLRKVLARFPHIRRLIVVADRGLLSLDNLNALGKLELPGQWALEFILAVPGRRYGEFTEVLQAIQAKAGSAQQEIIEKTRWQQMRLVVAHHPQRALEQTLLRNERIAALQEQAQAWAGKLDGQDAGVKAKGRKLSDSGAKARLYHAVCEAHLAKIMKVDLKSELFAYTVDEAAKAQAELMDGKLLLVTNVADLKPREVLSRYKARG